MNATDLQQPLEIKADFISMAAHELRRPLTLMQGYLEMLLDGELGPFAEEQYDSLEIINSNVEAITTTLNQLIDLMRLEADRIVLHRQPVDIISLVEPIIAQFQTRRLILVMDADFPPVLCDEDRTIQVIENLLEYLQQHTSPEETLVMQWTVVPAGGYVQLSLSSHEARPTDSALADRLETFFLTETAGLKPGENVALALYLARFLVERQDGCLWFENRPDQAGLFHLTLPVVETTSGLSP